MKTYTKFLINGFIKSFLNVFFIMISLVLVLNILKEIEFFSNKEVNSFYPIYLSFMSSPSIVFEMFPFIFLIATQFFFLKLFDNDEINIFKYSGLKNSQILRIISFLTFFISLFLITIFYNFSSNLKSYYLDLKTKYTLDGKYLAVITNNGLWIRDVLDNKTVIINADKISGPLLLNASITEFNINYKIQNNYI